MVIAVEMELGRQAKRGGIGTGVIFDHISHSLAYCEVDTTHPPQITSLFQDSIKASVVQNLLHSSMATLQPPPTTALSSAWAGAR